MSSPALEEQLSLEIEAFLKADRESPPPPGQILFIGSSSIAGWTTLANDMAPMGVINRGFGGSHIRHINYWFDEIVEPYAPSEIVFYAGENDIAAGVAVASVVNDFEEFLDRKLQMPRNPKVYYISVKPSPARIDQLKIQSDLNDKIWRYSKERDDVEFLDIVSAMCAATELSELFLPDKLHMNSISYRIWAQIVRKALSHTMIPDAAKRSDRSTC